MGNHYSWIFVDHENDIWKFSLESGELCCRITYGDESGTKKGVLDKNILGFSVYIEKEGKIHIVYSNDNGQIKYCTLKENKWYGRILQLMESSGFEICNIKTDIIDDEMHIFYLMIEKSRPKHGVLVHSIWNGRETRSMKLSDIVLIPDGNENYIINTDKDKSIDLLFITEDEGEPAISYCCYRDGEWTRMKRLYSIRGKEISFELYNSQEFIHILNKHREGGRYYLDHIRYSKSGDLKKYSVYEGSQELDEPLIFRVNERLYVSWLEDNRIFYSQFDGFHWSGPDCFNSKTKHQIERYHFSIACDSETMIKEKDVYGTEDTELELFFPSEIVTGKKLQETSLNPADGAPYDDEPPEAGQNEKVSQTLQLQLYREKSENNRLKATIASLNAQLQKKQSTLDSYKDKFEKLLDQKKNTDENCDMFIELQQNLQGRVESLDRKLREEKEGAIILENRLKGSEAEREALKREIAKLMEEKGRLMKESEVQNNKTFMERLLKM